MVGTTLKLSSIFRLFHVNVTRASPENKGELTLTSIRFSRSINSSLPLHPKGRCIPLFSARHLLPLHNVGLATTCYRRKMELSFRVVPTILVPHFCTIDKKDLEPSFDSIANIGHPFSPLSCASKKYIFHLYLPLICAIIGLVQQLEGLMRLSKSCFASLKTPVPILSHLLQDLHPQHH